MMEESIFAKAITLSLAERDSYLREACGDDDKLLHRVRKLLDAHEQTNSFLDQPAVQDSEPIPETESIGNYRLLQRIGEGGFGVVYMAEQVEPVRRKVALKVIKPGMDSQAVIARFEAERQALAMMDHPNIARVLDGGTIGQDGIQGEFKSGLPYFVMELVHGVPITEYCDKNKLTTRERLMLFQSVCNAVHHAHQKGIIHRDIKPSNVMVTLHDGHPVVKVIDFGVAKALHQRLTERTMFTEYGQMIGTPQYMSPEQAEMSGLDIDTRSDVYSLCVLLYELLTGTAPLEAAQLRQAGFLEIQRLIREEDPPLPSQRVSSDSQKATVVAEHRSSSALGLHREIRGDLDWIVMKGLEKNRQRRYDSAQNLAEDIARVLEHQPVLARRPSAAYRISKFVRRNRTACGGAIVLCALVLGLLGFIWRDWHDRQQVQRRDTAALQQLLEQSSLLLGKAEQAPAGSGQTWTSLEQNLTQIQTLLESTNVDPAITNRATALVNSIEEAQQDYIFANRVEEMLILRATSMDLTSWNQMEEEFRSLFRQRGLNLDTMDPAEVGKRIRDDRAQYLLSDALELWLGTRGQLASMGGPRLTATEMQPWADAMYVADSDPLRTGIRKFIYQAEPATKENLRKLVAASDLEQATPRTLSWLATVYMMVGDPAGSNRVSQRALRQHPDDLMLNFDYALMLSMQQKHEQAIRYLMRCTAVRPQIPGVWKSLGEALRKNGELNESTEVLQHLIELEPDNVENHVELARTLLAQNAYQAVLNHFEPLPIDWEKQIYAWRCMGLAYQGLQDWAQARDSFETCDQLAKQQGLNLPTQEWLSDLATAEASAKSNDEEAE